MCKSLFGTMFGTRRRAFFCVALALFSAVLLFTVCSDPGTGPNDPGGREPGNGGQPAARHMLTISVSPMYSGTFTPASGESHEAGKPVAITATPAAGYEFKNWLVVTGGQVANENSAATTITLTSAASVMAYFQPSGASVGHMLTVNVSPAGSGSVARNPSLTEYAAGTSVTLTATAEYGYTFAGWTDGVSFSSTNNPVTVTMSANRTMTAQFTQDSAEPCDAPGTQACCSANPGHPSCVCLFYPGAAACCAYDPQSPGCENPCAGLTAAEPGSACCDAQPAFNGCDVLPPPNPCANLTAAEPGSACCITQPAFNGCIAPPPPPPDDGPCAGLVTAAPGTPCCTAQPGFDGCIVTPPPPPPDDGPCAGLVTAAPGTLCCIAQPGFDGCIVTPPPDPCVVNPGSTACCTATPDHTSCPVTPPPDPCVVNPGGTVCCTTTPNHASCPVTPPPGPCDGLTTAAPNSACCLAQPSFNGCQVTNTPKYCYWGVGECYLISNPDSPCTQCDDPSLTALQNCDKNGFVSTSSTCADAPKDEYWCKWPTGCFKMSNPNGKDPDSEGGALTYLENCDANGFVSKLSDCSDAPTLEAGFCNWGPCVGGSGYGCASGGCYRLGSGGAAKCEADYGAVVTTCPAGTKPPAADY
ncbi:MAG: hypothetical protein FWB85_10750 [Chitinispirillia bacterium]|nr:hypothetical protein [Chitinispirillia bacterium]MCL2242643.1 hypothetical protein [Chitinispirillia bacterium]